jgi:hypothetical protein
MSCELGLPCLVPLDALEIKPCDEAALSPEFTSKIRIALYVARTNSALGDNNPTDVRSRINMALVLEKDLNSLVSSLRQSPEKWDSSVEFVYLVVLLNLCCNCLRWTPATSLDATDSLLMQSSAAQCARQLIELYANSDLCAGRLTSPQDVHMRYYAKYYVQFNIIALLVLSRISALNQISPQQLEEVDDAIRLGHSALMACSASDGDECYRAAAVVEVLCKKHVVSSSIQAGRGSTVQSRHGASLWLELVHIAVSWRRRHAAAAKGAPTGLEESSSAADADDTGNGVAEIGEDQGLTAARRAPAPGDDAMGASRSTTGGELDTATMTIADLGEVTNIFPLHVTDEDWTASLGFSPAELGVSYDSGWWGGVDMLGW